MSQSGDSAGEVADHLFRHEGAKVVATLTAHLGTHRLQLAEDVVQEALLRALQTWSYRGVPENPAAWLTQVAKHLRSTRCNASNAGTKTSRHRRRTRALAGRAAR
jgi:predicted RNA polymerase sigma factor